MLDYDEAIRNGGDGSTERERRWTGRSGVLDAWGDLVPVRSLLFRRQWQSGLDVTRSCPLNAPSPCQPLLPPLHAHLSLPYVPSPTRLFNLL